MLGRALTPLKIAARVARVFWVNAVAEWLLGQKAAVPQRPRMLLTLRTRSGSAVRFESTPLLPEAECMV